MRPAVVDAAPSTAAIEGQGFIVPNFERGALLLKNATGAIYRLSWNEDEPATTEADNSPDGSPSKTQDPATTDARRALPAGAYTLIGYRLNRTDKDNVRWDLSASHPKLRKLKVQDGKQLQVQIDETIRIRHRLSQRQFGINVLGTGASGLTIYRAETRIPIEFELHDALGDKRFDGRIRYG